MVAGSNAAGGTSCNAISPAGVATLDSSWKESSRSIGIGDILTYNLIGFSALPSSRSEMEIDREGMFVKLQEKNPERRA